MDKSFGLSWVRGEEANGLLKGVSSGSAKMTPSTTELQKLFNHLMKVQCPNIAGDIGESEMLHNPPIKIFCINGDYIVALKREEAVQDYMNRVDDCPVDKLDIEELSIDKEGRFETENGWVNETFAEFLGKDFKYTKPQVICWQE